MPNYTNAIWSDAIEVPTYGRLERDLVVDVAIVGAGITGVTAARLLKDAGLKVALVEARRAGKGETGKTTAHLTEVLDTRYHDLISKFGAEGARLAARGQRAAIDRIAAFVRERKIACQLETVPGFLYAETASGAKTVEHEEAAARRLGIAVTRVDTVPLPFKVNRAIRFDDQAQFHPRRYLLALLAEIDGDGSHVLEDTQVLDVDEGKEQCLVTTDKATITARDVIIAAHVPFLNRFAMHTKLAAYRSYAIGLALPTVGPSGLFWDVAEPYHYIRSHVMDGVPYLIVGGEDHKVGEQEDTTVPFQRLESFVSEHFRRTVGVTDFRWSGQILESADGLPYIGRNTSDTHVYVATGYSGNGLTNGTLAAMILSDQIRGVENPWTKLLDATRFKPLASAKAFVTENIDFPKHLIADRFVGMGHEADLAAIPAGEGRIVRVGGSKLAVYRAGGGALTALSPVCTHLGCLVHWNTTEKSWDCPCHGSRFDPTGRVLNGPATTPLEVQPLPEPKSPTG